MALSPEGKFSGLVSRGCVEGAVYDAGNEVLKLKEAKLLRFALAALSLFVRLRPDPRDVGRVIAEIYTGTVYYQETKRSTFDILSTPAVLAAASGMIVGQIVVEKYKYFVCEDVDARGYKLDHYRQCEM
jgi:xanthine/CO dehydrogenase XdhC/CoxF family maturation factor